MRSEVEGITDDGGEKTDARSEQELAQADESTAWYVEPPLSARLTTSVALIVGWLWLVVVGSSVTGLELLGPDRGLVGDNVPRQWLAGAYPLAFLALLAALARRPREAWSVFASVVCGALFLGMVSSSPETKASVRLVGVLAGGSLVGAHIFLQRWFTRDDRSALVPALAMIVVATIMHTSTGLPTTGGRSPVVR